MGDSLGFAVVGVSVVGVAVVSFVGDSESIVGGCVRDCVVGVDVITLRDAHCEPIHVKVEA